MKAARAGAGAAGREERLLRVLVLEDAAHDGHHQDLEGERGLVLGVPRADGGHDGDALHAVLLARVDDARSPVGQHRRAHVLGLAAERHHDTRHALALKHGIDVALLGDVALQVDQQHLIANL